MADEAKEDIRSILEELLEYTRDLAGYEEDPELDVPNLTRTCQEKLRLWQEKVSHSGGPISENSRHDPEIRDLLSALGRETEQSIQVLTRYKAQIEDELTTLRRSQKAVSAYGKRR